MLNLSILKRPGIQRGFLLGLANLFLMSCCDDHLVGKWICFGFPANQQAAWKQTFVPPKACQKGEGVTMHALNLKGPFFPLLNFPWMVGIQLIVSKRIWKPWKKQKMWEWWYKRILSLMCTLSNLMHIYGIWQSVSKLLLQGSIGKKQSIEFFSLRATKFLPLFQTSILLPWSTRTSASKIAGTGSSRPNGITLTPEETNGMTALPPPPNAVVYLHWWRWAGP